MAFHIVADENMPNIDPWFSPMAQSIVRKPGRELTPHDLQRTDVLLVRSITQVNEALLAGTPVKFVGSATIGTDHVDVDYLKKANVSFSHAPGCNAQSVTDWLLSVLSRLHLDHHLLWWQKTIGIVGVGGVGSKVAERLRGLGCRVVLCDPPKNELGLLPEHVSLSDVMKSCDIVCLHAPQTTEGRWPTLGMVDAEQLNLMRPGSWLINAGRGTVIQGHALEGALVNARIQAVLDVWPNEPTASESLLKHVELASPHVAGYSLEGKYTGTQMLAQACYEWAGLEFPKRNDLPYAGTLDALQYVDDNIDRWVSQMVLAVYDPMRDTHMMRNALHNGVLSPQTFDGLRKHYPVRRELASVCVDNAPLQLKERLRQFGFARFGK